MNDFNFNNCRNFLERVIEANPENSELVKAYVTLIEKKTEADIQFLKGDEAVRKEWEKNLTERMKDQTEVQKKSIEKGSPLIQPSFVQPQI
ncbi:hypothetical protein Q4530_07350 [Colwellia sp. 1_MG-2023]|uniref:hypothetical protein n=1 Tax=unclassified Colwellia TaxID=196834 RepID=UPI0010228F6E|nr:MULTISPECIES: hypothetical protein [unclassified Colwellia]RYV02114.1 hypothetical protein SOPP22_11135 [Shewanella sp. OPT22]MBU2926449.1 hypothetical protein [Colwellia sp. C2M11]MDO6652487.1 hypothetical protein [Colwellia sp. 3_MG-2023]MDO6665088.1 hypothetical protein [Colwellia sp. 2_MG-2023]MDO6689590.1 hypothetical protein [Colwellia sp. 1_MG-2023]